MDEVQRKLSFDDLFEEKTIEFLNEFDQSMICFENLSNELLCDIFDYLDGYQLFQAFSNLNSRFEQLIHSSCVLIKTCFCIYQNNKVLNTFEQFIFSNRHQIFSIYLNFILQNSYLFSWYLFDSSFDRLESLLFKVIQSNTLMPMLDNLSSLPHLSSLTIETYCVEEQINDIYQLIFILPKLRYYRISSFNHHRSITLLMAMNNQFSPVEYLVINRYCSLNELESLISYTPQLRCLTLHKTKTNGLNVTVLSSTITLANLQSISLDLCQARFNELELFITKIFSNLKSLSIIGSRDITFLNAYRWKQLILNHFSQLEKLYLTYYDRMDNNNQYPIYTGRVNQFSSSFWIQRKWIFHVQIKGIYNKYMIYPYKKPCYDYIEDNNIEYSTAPSLMLAIDLNGLYLEMLFERIKCVLTMTQIYHLEIIQEHIVPCLVILFDTVKTHIV
ncbi:unnamed protein product [Rotaria sordida]|uniref:F-box domain-containing protein n=1 Tax=Rotaria sordida TaxID=392033 RepID=A0A814US11_9BILA|nr:unnamed protein product [Rotaria sordida]CAF1442223.1 unnamed protein product [Rotaria sordida]